MKGTLKLIVAAALMVAASSPLFAQQQAASKPADQPVNEQVAMVRAGLQGDRKQLVAANMELTPQEATAFWPVYDEYRKAMTGVNDHLVKVIADYAQNYETLTDAQAQKLVVDGVQYEKQKAEMRAAWVPKFAKVLSGKKVARFYQVENRIDTLMQAALQQGIPLVK